MRIKLNNGGRPKNLLSNEEKEWLENFFMRPDITYITPGKNQQKYIGKTDGESRYAQIRYLLWNLKDLFQITNGNKLVDNHGFEEQFSKPITFRQLYEFIKEHPEFVYNKDIPQSGCLCEICENTVYIAKALAQRFNEIPTNPHDIVETYSCESSNRECMEGDCDACSIAFREGETEEEAMSVNQWSKVDKKARKISITFSITELIAEFNSKVSVLKSTFM